MSWLIVWLGVALTMAGPGTLTKAEAKEAANWGTKFQLEDDAIAVVGVSLRLQGASGRLEIEVEPGADVSGASGAQDIALPVIVALYLGSDSSFGAPLGPGGRLAKKGMRSDIVWTVRVTGERVEPVEVVLGDDHIASDYDPGAKTLLPLWLPRESFLSSEPEAQAGCSVRLYGHGVRGSEWFDETGAFPVRVQTAYAVPVWKTLIDVPSTWRDSPHGPLWTYLEPDTGLNEVSQTEVFGLDVARVFQMREVSGEEISFRAGLHRTDFSVVGGASGAFPPEGVRQLTFTDEAVWTRDQRGLVAVRPGREPLRVYLRTENDEGIVERLDHSASGRKGPKIELYAPDGRQLLSFRPASRKVELQNWECPAPLAPVSPAPASAVLPQRSMYGPWGCSPAGVAYRVLQAPTAVRAETLGEALRRRLELAGLGCASVVVEGRTVSVFTERDEYSKGVVRLLSGAGVVSLYTDAPSERIAALGGELAEHVPELTWSREQLAWDGGNAFWLSDELLKAEAPANVRLEWDVESYGQWNGWVLEPAPAIPREELTLVSYLRRSDLPWSNGVRLEVSPTGVAALKNADEEGRPTWVTLIVDDAVLARTEWIETQQNAVLFEFQYASAIEALLRTPVLDVDDVTDVTPTELP